MNGLDIITFILIMGVAGVFEVRFLDWLYPKLFPTKPAVPCPWCGSTKGEFWLFLLYPGAFMGYDRIFCLACKRFIRQSAFRKMKFKNLEEMKDSSN